MRKDNKKIKINPEDWGLTSNNIDKMPKIFNNLLSRISRCFKDKNDKYMLKNLTYYLKGLLLSKEKKTISEIARCTIDPHDDGQSLQYFITDSDWDYSIIFDKIQRELISKKELGSGILILDDSGIRKYGSHSIGSSRQYIGRDGKIENGQVIVSLGYFVNDLWTMVDSDLYIPKKWFETYSNDYLHEKWKLPLNRKFKTKIEIGLDMIKHVKENNLDFSIVACDTWFGRNTNFRYDLEKLSLTYMCKIPSNSKCLIELGLEKVPDKRWENDQYQLFPNNLTSSQIKRIIKDNDFEFEKIEVRQAERGKLFYECFCKQIKTKVTNKKNLFIDEWLLVYKDYNGSYKFSVSNAPLDVSLHNLALWNCQEYFIERIFEDCKSNLGLTELEARKYSSIMHHISICALCLWLIFLLKYEFNTTEKADDFLKKKFGITILPKLSTKNIIMILGKIIPLINYSLLNILEIVTIHLIDRSKSISSKYRKQIKAEIYDDF